MKETNDKINKKSKSLFSKLSSKNNISNSKSNKITKKSKSEITNSINSTNKKSTEDTKELNTILKINERSRPVEYYDLPYRYNQTVIKILAQTPHAIFIYWDISDFDRKMMIEKYGENFFNETKPILLVHNQTLGYSFEVEIDDFANSWYLRTPTSNCVFNIELGRKKIVNNDSIIINTDDNILHITSSNTLESPNDHVLVESLNKTVYFKNIKTNELEEKKISNLKPINNIYNMFELSSNEVANNPSSNFKI